MKLSKTGLELIQHFEGYERELPNGSCRAYPDVGSSDGKPYTIGWGTTRYRSAGLAKYGRNHVNLSDTLTREEAELELQAEIRTIEAKLASEKFVSKLNQNQYDALVSFCYNTGFPLPQMRRLRDGKLDEFSRFLLLYVKGANGKELPGLVRRRKAERELWDTLTGEKPKEDKIMQVTWINIVRHEHEQKPSYKLYAMNGGDCLAVHDFTTRLELIKILEKYPSAGNATVGELNWHVEPKDNAEPKTNILKLERTGVKEPGGCEELLLSLDVADKSWIVRSGQPWAQVFQHGGPENRPGSMMPLPGGKWSVGPIEFAGGRDNWSTVWGPGLGPCWVGVEPMFKTRRGAIGFHVDTGSYGTAGCIGFRNNEEMKTFVKALREYDPKTLEVMW